jgi:hypothetical protein
LRYDNIQVVPNNRFIVTTGDWNNRRYGVYTSSGNEIQGLSFGRYEQVRAAGDRHFIARDGDQWGVLDATGNTTLNFRYDSISFTGNDTFIVRDGDRVGVVGLNGQETISMGTFDTISHLFGGFYQVTDIRDGQMERGVVDARGTFVIPMGRYNIINSAPGDRFIVRSGGEWNPDRGEMDTARWAVIDTRGNEIIAPGRFDAIRVIPSWGMVQADEGFIVVSGQGESQRVGAMDINGNEIIPLGRYDDIGGIYNRLALVERNDRIGVINTRRID